MRDIFDHLKEEELWHRAYKFNYESLRAKFEPVIALEDILDDPDNGIAYIDIHFDSALWHCTLKGDATQEGYGSSITAAIESALKAKVEK